MIDLNSYHFNDREADIEITECAQIVMIVRQTSSKKKKYKRYKYNLKNKKTKKKADLFIEKNQSNIYDL